MDLYQIYVVFHKYLIDNCYKNDKSFDINKYSFIKCNELFKPQYNKSFGYKILYEKDFKLYNPKLQDLKKPYMAVSAIYHIYLNKLYKNLKYVGFIEYDISLEIDPKFLDRNKNNKEIQSLKIINNITEHITKILSEHKKIIIVLSSRNRYRVFYNEANNCLIKGKNIFDIILAQFNDFYNTNHTHNELWKKNPLICDQQSFLADIETFEIIMKFISHLIENKIVEIKGFRPSFLLARYIGITIELLEISTKILSLKHLNKKEW